MNYIDTLRQVIDGIHPDMDTKDCEYLRSIGQIAIQQRDALVAALRAFVERGNKLSGFPNQYDPWIGELVLARATLAALDKTEA